MKRLTLILRVVLFFGLLQAVACKKSIDLVSTESSTLATSSDATLANEFSNCKLRRIVHKHPYYPDHFMNGLFSYNSAGNPHSLNYSGQFHSWYYRFYYDKKNRLTQYRRFLQMESGGLAYHEIHRYGYDNNDMIIVDSVFFLRTDVKTYDPSESINAPGDPYDIINLTYDGQGRIVKESIRRFYDTKPYRNPTYTYDNRGNLAVRGWKSSGYDNKVSIFRAHPLFQFINRNYSRNNALPQLNYNSKGFPLVINELNDSFFDAYQSYGSLKLIYDCQ